MRSWLFYHIGLPRKRWARRWRVWLYRLTGVWPWGIIRFCIEVPLPQESSGMKFTEKDFMDFLEAFGTKEE